MKYYYLIIALDKLTGNFYNPNPCLFETEKEAKHYLKINKNKTVSYAYKKVMVGKFNC